MIDKISKVLVLHSFNDKGYESRVSQIKNNINLDLITFEHVCVIDPTRGSVLLSKINEIANKSGINETVDELTSEFIKKEIEPLLFSVIENFKPEVFIIHGGTIMERYTGAILTVLINIKNKFPNLILALEQKNDFIERKKAFRSANFNNYGIRQMVSNQIDWIRQNFENNVNVEKIIGEIF